MPVALGQLETQLFAYAQLRERPMVRSGEVAGALGLTPTQTRELLSRLSRRNLIARVRRGLYLVPPRIPPGGRWSPGDFVALATLMADRGGKYQICGPSAFHRYGWDSQVPNRVYVYNNQISGERQIGATALSLIKVSDERLGRTESFKTPDGVETVYSSRARSLVDAVYDWSRFGSLPRGYEWIREELNRDKSAAVKITEVALKYGNTSTLRRIGKLLEIEGVDPQLLKKLKRKLPETTALIPWSPTKPKRGRVDRKWGLVFNE